MSVNSHSSPASKRRRRPAQARAKETVGRILDGAAHVFATRGYGATTNHVAEAAGVSIGSIYQYFPDKDALLVALHSRHLDHLEARLLGGGPRHDPSGWVRWLVNELIAANQRPEADALWAMSRVVPDMRVRVSRLVDRLVLDARTALGVSTSLRARAVVVTALAVVHELVFPRPTPRRRREAVDAVLAVASAGVHL